MPKVFLRGRTASGSFFEDSMVKPEMEVVTILATLIPIQLTEMDLEAGLDKIHFTGVALMVR